MGDDGMDPTEPVEFEEEMEDCERHTRWLFYLRPPASFTSEFAVCVDALYQLELDQAGIEHPNQYNPAQLRALELLFPQAKDALKKDSHFLFAMSLRARFNMLEGPFMLRVPIGSELTHETLERILLDKHERGVLKQFLLEAKVPGPAYPPATKRKDKCPPRPKVKSKRKSKRSSKNTKPTSTGRSNQV